MKKEGLLGPVTRPYVMIRLDCLESIDRWMKWAETAILENVKQNNLPKADGEIALVAVQGIQAHIVHVMNASPFIFLRALGEAPVPVDPFDDFNLLSQSGEKEWGN